MYFYIYLVEYIRDLLELNARKNSEAITNTNLPIRNSFGDWRAKVLAASQQRRRRWTTGR